MTLAGAALRTTRYLPALGLGLMILFSILIALHAIGFQARISGDPAFHARFDQIPVFATMHVLGGAVVLLVGGFQFWSRIRLGFPVIHRWMGRVYLSFVFAGGIAGLVLAPQSAGGVVAHFGFGLLAVLWLYSGARAYLAIRAGDVALHRAWMMRNFAMAFGAVTLRVYLGLFALAGIPFSESYPTVAWLSWVPNLILVEWYLAESLNRARQGATSP